MVLNSCYNYWYNFGQYAKHNPLLKFLDDVMRDSLHIVFADDNSNWSFPYINARITTDQGVSEFIDTCFFLVTGMIVELLLKYMRPSLLYALLDVSSIGTLLCTDLKKEYLINIASAFVSRYIMLHFKETSIGQRSLLQQCIFEVGGRSLETYNEVIEALFISSLCLYLVAKHHVQEVVDSQNK